MKSERFPCLVSRDCSALNIAGLRKKYCRKVYDSHIVLLCIGSSNSKKDTYIRKNTHTKNYPQVLITARFLHSLVVVTDDSGDVSGRADEHRALLVHRSGHQVQNAGDLAPEHTRAVI